jgi:hypothetical protein
METVLRPLAKEMAGQAAFITTESRDVEIKKSFDYQY